MDRLPPHLADVVARLVEGLRELYGKRFRGLLLYGSYARGEARTGSDVDLLLLLDGPVDPIQEIVRMEPVTWPLSLEGSVVLSVMPASLQAFERAESSFLQVVRDEAVRAA